MKNRFYLVMLYCDGGSLDKLISKLLLPEPVIAHIFLRVATGLYYLERQCLVHRDVVSRLQMFFVWVVLF